MTYSTTIVCARLLLLGLTAATALGGCDPERDPSEGESSGESGEADPTDGPTGSTDENDTEGTMTPGETEGETEGDTPVHQGLFACELPQSCSPILWHIDPTDEPEAVQCAAELLVSGEPGVLHALSTPGPDIDEDETLLLVRGDGTALVQTRHRSCTDCDDPPWEAATTLQECEIPGIEALAAACEAGEGCQWWPWDNLGTCTDVDEPTCEAAAILAGA